ncbi:MAG: hypothetical protein KGH67_05855 [Candidatus Micrarchaeota archaeon]|nr:hypothetical protein [Candidatus Micrarchaeota archaeon]
MEQNRYVGKQITLVEAEKQADEARGPSRFISIPAGHRIRLSFTGKVYERHASGIKDDGPWEAEKFDFELEHTINGVGHQFFSLAKGNKIVPELIRQLKAGNKVLSISKDRNNRYGLKVA